MANWMDVVKATPHYQFYAKEKKLKESNKPLAVFELSLLYAREFVGIGGEIDE